jgi:catechol 2,3-dioxygenase-like lactoylglutathione lyase family enzyme
MSSRFAQEGKMLDFKLEAVMIPVSDVDRAKRFYEKLGWRLDADFTNGSDWRAMQLTPPGSPASVLFGKGFTTAAPGSVKGTFLVVEDVDAARAQLKDLGVDVSEVFHFEGPLRVTGTQGRVAGRHPENKSYSSWAEFSDPDGNTWLLQEIKTRLPGRGVSNWDVATLTQLLKDTEKAHGAYEGTAPKHHWSDWYAAYVVALQQGATAEDAARKASMNVEARRPRE